MMIETDSCLSAGLFVLSKSCTETMTLFEPDASLPYSKQSCVSDLSLSSGFSFHKRREVVQLRKHRIGTQTPTRTHARRFLLKQFTLKHLLSGGQSW
jgi:hypothetical protein